MRFPLAWAAMAKQNNVLRIAIIGVTFTGLIALLISLKFAFKDPLIVERGCYSKIASKASNQEPSKEEFEAFINEALSQRFDSDKNVESDYLGIEELKNRENEQEELKKRSIKQKVILNSVSKKDDKIIAETDRLLSVGPLRSAFQFPLTLQVERQSRSQANPYGLILFKVTPQNQDEGKKNEKNNEKK